MSIPNNWYWKLGLKYAKLHETIADWYMGTPCSFLFRLGLFLMLTMWIPWLIWGFYWLFVLGAGLFALNMAIFILGAIFHIIGTLFWYSHIAYFQDNSGPYMS